MFTQEERRATISKDIYSFATDEESIAYTKGFIRGIAMASKALGIGEMPQGKQLLSELNALLGDSQDGS